ncbi:MAG: SH3 domain-containing protein [Marinibacterium sp.]|nr:SH3 domain-containing protein [Marinibacterium sp.]
MRFVLITFLFMGFAFYELSGGSDFEPRKSSEDFETAQTENLRLRAGDDVTVPDPVKVAVVIDAPKVVHVKPVATPAAETAETPQASAPQPSLAFRFHQPTSDAEDDSVQLVSLADGSDAFPQSVFLDPGVGTTPTNSPMIEQPEAAADPVEIREVTGSRVNMRQGPGTTYPVIGTLFYDDKVEVLDDLGHGWVQLRKVGDNRIGWMAARFVGKPAN